MGVYTFHSSLLLIVLSFSFLSTGIHVIQWPLVARPAASCRRLCTKNRLILDAWVHLGAGHAYHRRRRCLSSGRQPLLELHRIVAFIHDVHQVYEPGSLYYEGFHLHRIVKSLFHKTKITTFRDNFFFSNKTLTPKHIILQ